MRYSKFIRMGAFHDSPPADGTLPIAVVEALMFEDEASLRQALEWS
jgi:hypothetical protein